MTVSDDNPQSGAPEGAYGPPPYPPGYGPPPPYGTPTPQGSGPPAYGSYLAAPTPQPERFPDFPHPEPRDYSQMLRTWNYAWWKPVVGIIVVLTAMVLVVPLALLPLLAIGVAIEDQSGGFYRNFTRAATLAEVGPAALLYLNVVLGSMILVTWAVMRLLHRMRPRWLASVAPKMRWSFFFACVGVSIVALAAQVGVGFLLPGDDAGQDAAQLNTFTSTTVVLAVIVLLTTPFQAAGEEYVFRGYLMQATGSLFGNRWVALLLTAFTFGLAHGAQNFPLFFDRFMFGLIAGWLVLRTGGLEAGIAMHILNNFLAFGFALLFGDLSASLRVSEAPWSNIILTLTQSVVYAGLVLLIARKFNLQTRTRPPGTQPAEMSSGVGGPLPTAQPAG